MSITPRTEDQVTDPARSVPYYADDAVTLWHGDCLDVLATLPDGSVDAVVTDPPYGLGFMGREWDALPPGREWAAECLRVLKPGGHMLAFGGTRTAHRLACAIEDAGFELRDTIAWLYGSGFPKSRNLDGDWQGWGTALKPANEPIIVARKSPIGTVAANVLAHGTGALNIDGCRTEGTVPGGGNGEGRSGGIMGKTVVAARPVGLPHDRGRWPTNVVLDPDTAAALDAQSGTLTSSKRQAHHDIGRTRGACYGAPSGEQYASTYDDQGGASRFFPTFRYEAKAPTDERPKVGTVAHPTVKPLDLMRWLVRLVTPPGGVVLEPFAGSGTTAEACIVEGFRCIAIEREGDYLPLILARITKPIEAVLDGGIVSLSALFPYYGTPERCPHAACHRGPQAPDEDVAQCAWCGAGSYSVRRDCGGPRSDGAVSDA